MAFKHKFSYEEKIKIVTEYLNNKYGFRETCQIYGINQGSLKAWSRLYKTFGVSGLQTGNKCSKYSAEVKKAAIYDYLSRNFTMPEILIKYEIRSATQLQRWLLKYNSYEVLKSSESGVHIPAHPDGYSGFIRTVNRSIRTPCL